MAFSEVVSFRCSKCGWSQDLRRHPCLRRFEGATLKLPYFYAWCLDQGRIVLSEWFPSLEDLAAERAEVAELRQSMPEEDMVDVPTLDWVDQQIRWRRQRVSPPRCLECGTTRLVRGKDPRDTASPIEHPGCGGDIAMSGLRYVEEESPPLVLDAEGGVIRS